MPANQKLPFKRPHFIGIGGIGMSGIARLMMSRGVDLVQGSDVQSGSACVSLEKLGAKIFIGHDPSLVEGADVVIYSSSIPPTHPERQEAIRRNIPVIHRSEALKILCQGCHLISVTGTHGKTTTTSLVGMIYKEALRDPSIVVGGWVSEFGGNALDGHGADMVIEADESDGSFLNFNPDISVVTNIEAEHMDHYQTMDKMMNAYEKFLGECSRTKIWVGCAEDQNILKIHHQLPAFRLYGFARHPQRLWASDIVECPGGKKGVEFVAHDGEKTLGRIQLSIPGRHNVLNAMAAIAVAIYENIPFSIVASALVKYSGAGRRFDVKFENENYMVVDDYAHHPTEIEKTLSAARGFGKNRVIALFQPHRYTRTESLMSWFGTSFKYADRLLLTDIYAASESPREGVTGFKLYEEVKRSGHPDVSFVPREALADAARLEIQPGDLLLVMGAGDISQVANQVSEGLRTNGGAKAAVLEIPGKVLFEESLAKHTTLKIGGPAEFWIEPEDESALKIAMSTAKRYGIRTYIFGNGSNLLAPDEGLRGMVIHLGSPYFKKMWQEEGLLMVRAGVPNSIFIHQAMQMGFGGYEFLSGIPGNIGGAVAMNAGSHGQDIAPYIDSIRCMDKDGRIIERKGSDIHFKYRHTDLKEQIVVEAKLRFPTKDASDVQKILDEYHQYRQKTQDLRHASAGCMFKNPEDKTYSSGKLIDEAGLKGLTVGGAQISTIHGNYLINAGNATAKDVRELIRMVQLKILETKKIQLETEVKILS